MNIQRLFLTITIFLGYSCNCIVASEHKCTLTTPNSDSAKASLIPHPVEIDWQYNDVCFTHPKVEMPKQINPSDFSYLRQELNEIFDESEVSETVNTSHSTCRVQLSFKEMPNAQIPTEAYELLVDGNTIRIKAETTQGMFNALQTLKQLVFTKESKKYIAGCSIRDWPAFNIRGIMLDCGRNFMSVDFIKKHIENLSRYKINTLHLHITEDQAWRLQIKKYPQLVDEKYHWATRQPGMFYTQENIKELVNFCNERYIMIIPEIDMPGHSKSFRRAMGVDMQSDNGIEYLRNILDETCALFPGPYFHLGSDEVKIRMKEFMPTMVEYVRSKGKTPIVWNPGNIPDKQVINMHWGQHAGHEVDKTMKHIDTNGFYMDWIDSQSGVLQYFFQQPCDVATGSETALGAIAPVWTDGALSHEDRLIEQYPFYPCMLTFAERSWRGANEKRTDLMAQMPKPGSSAYIAFSEFEERLVEHRDLYLKNEPFAYVKQSNINWSLIGPFNHKGKNESSFEPEHTIKGKYNDDNKTLRWNSDPAWGGAIHIRHFYDVFDIHRNIYRNEHWPTDMSSLVEGSDGTCYALTYINSPIEQEIHLMFGLNGMWGHSGGYRSARAPEQGSWDFSGGDVWLNDKKIEPPIWPFKSLPWTGWGRGRIEEAPLTEEGYFYRPPVKIALKEGLNKVLIRSVFGHWKGDEGQRKWFFCCIPVSWNGSNYKEVEGLTYNSDISNEILYKAELLP